MADFDLRVECRACRALNLALLFHAFAMLRNNNKRNVYRCERTIQSDVTNCTWQLLSHCGICVHLLRIYTHSVKLDSRLLGLGLYQSAEHNIHQ